MEHAAANAKQVEHGRDAASRRGAGVGAAPALHPALELQQQMGNQAMQALLRGGFIQAKLAISQPDDPEEQEADATAGRVMRSHAGAGAAASSCSCGDDEEGMCDACRQTAAVSRKAAGDAGVSSASAHRVLDTIRRSPGHAMDAATRAFFEPRFGRDFSAVRIHTDSSAASSARSIQAHAFTAGSEIYFAPGQYAPESVEGKKLLAHELTHTIQQGASGRSSAEGIHQRGLNGVFSGIQRQVAGAPDPDKFNRCKNLLDLIKETVAVLLQRAADLINDPLGLQWDNWNTPKILPDGTNVGSVVGHQQQYEGWRNRLRNQIDEWDNDDCNSTGLRVLQDARDLQFKPAPAPTPRPRPDTGPKPWNAPGTAPSENPTAQRVGAAARGAAIGATAGLILGGIAGALGGGAAGTLVAPGVGTVGGGVAGAIEGAQGGAAIGAALGAGIGGLIGWLSGS